MTPAVSLGLSGQVVQGFFPGGFVRGRAAGVPASASPTPGKALQPSAGRPPATGRINGAQAFPISWPQAGSPGRPLPESVQAKMESFFHADFSGVRIHVGGEASTVGALALTQGSKIYFAHGHYDPATPRGQRLLAHELAHVVQQRAGKVRNPFGSGVALVQDPGLEAEAERAATAFVARGIEPVAPIQAKPAVAPTVLRVQPRPVSPVRSGPTLRPHQMAPGPRIQSVQPRLTPARMADFRGRTIPGAVYPYGPVLQRSPSGVEVIQPSWGLQDVKNYAYNVVSTIGSLGSIATGIATALQATGAAWAIPAFISAGPAIIRLIWDRLASESVTYTDQTKDAWYVKLTDLATQAVGLALPPLLQIVGVTSATSAAWAGSIAVVIAAVGWIALSAFTDKFDTWEKLVAKAVALKIRTCCATAQGGNLGYGTV